MSSQLHCQVSQREKLQRRLFDDIRQSGGSTTEAVAVIKWSTVALDSPKNIG
jgi:hypothetical protein